MPTLLQDLYDHDLQKSAEELLEIIGYKTEWLRLSEEVMSLSTLKEIAELQCILQQCIDSIRSNRIPTDALQEGLRGFLRAAEETNRSQIR